MKTISASSAFITILTTLALTACSDDAQRENPENLATTTGSGETLGNESPANQPRNVSSTNYDYAVASLEPTQGFEASGMVRFVDQGDSILVQANVEGLANGRHGIHIHENGDCSAADASSAGGHFAPQGSPHGAPSDPADESHTGDLGNITADSAGRAQLNRPVEFLSFNGNNSIMGKAVIIHAEADDLNSQPSGDAGERVACGVITSMEDPIASHYKLRDSVAAR